MKKYSGHKLYKFQTGHTLRSECETIKILEEIAERPIPSVAK